MREAVNSCRALARSSPIELNLAFNGCGVFRKVISFTDFPGTGITFFYRDNVLILPSEY